MKRKRRIIFLLQDRQIEENYQVGQLFTVHEMFKISVYK